MAVPAVTFYNRRPIVPQSNFAEGYIRGSVNVTSYDNTHPALTALTGKFKNSTGANSTLSVHVSGPSSAGFSVAWDPATTSFKCYGSNGAAPAALAEATNTAAVGTFQFIAYGQISA